MANDSTWKVLGITALALVLSSQAGCGSSGGSGLGSGGSGSGDSASDGSGGTSDGNGSGGDGTSASSDGDGSSSDGSSSDGSSSDGSSGDGSGGTSSADGSSGDGSSSNGSGGDGSGGSASGSGTTGGSTITPIVGGGDNSAPLGAGCGPDTAGECHPKGGDCAGTAFDDHEIKSAGSTCFFGEGLVDPSATVEHVTEVVDGQEYVHIRVTFDPDFVDTVYGECSPNTGWSHKRGHTFKDLVGSDHVELMLYSCGGDLSMHFKLDFIEEDASSACGYRSAGVSGGDGDLIVGSVDDVLAATSSLDRNMNGCGYCETVDSACTDETYASDPDAPQWDFRVVYEVWLDPAAFGDSGFCDVDIDYVHASPAKSDDDTIIVEPDDCPPGTGGSGGTGGSTSTTGSGGSGGNGGNGGSGGSGTGGSSSTGGSDCPPDYQLILTSEGEHYCEGPPDDNGNCPEGYVLDLLSEGELCISEDPVN